MKSILSIVSSAVLLSALASSAQELPSVTWTKLTSSQAPSARAYPAMAYDEQSKKVILFGGYDGTAYLNDTWSFDGTSWTSLHPVTSPPARTAANMTYDRQSSVVVLFGGFDGANYLGDTWLWDGKAGNWTEAHPVDSPKPVTGPSLFSDPRNGRATVFGGYDGRLYQSTTYQWTGSDWRQLHPDTVPYARSAALVGRDDLNKTVVLFGGLADLNPNNTWTWDGSDWTMQNPQTMPPHLYGPGAAFDGHLKGVISFGGGLGGVDQTDTWAWTGSNWVKLLPTVSPAAREGEGAAYDTATATLYIFGGGAGNGATYFNDTWKLVP